MKRDGSNLSIWQDHHESYQPLTSGHWSESKVYDVLIVGGGVTGLTTGVLLQKAGFKCILAEAQTIGFGTSLGTTSHLNTLLDTTYPEIENRFSEEAAKLVAKGASQAINLVGQLSGEMEIDCGFVRKNAWLLAETEEEERELNEIYDAVVRVGIGVSKVLTSPINLPLRAACCFDDQGQIDAGAYISGLAELFEESGGLIVENCRISEVSREQETHIANTERGTLRASRLFYATHIPPGVNQYSVLCAPYRSYAIAFTLADGSYPDGLVYDMKDPYNYFRTQRIGGQDYVIAGGFDHKTGHQENTDYIFTELEAFVRNYFSIDKIAYRWSSQYYEPADGLPYIGKYPGRDETYLATGFSGNGYTFGTLSALIISDLIKNGKSEYEDVFDPGRLKPIASAKNLFTENVDVLTKLIGGLFKDEKLEFWSELAPGEGKIVEWEGESLAVYRSESRELYVVDPICPHLGCKVNWNTTEKSWDCPCHGSRFACDGTLLTGPASSGLRRYDIELTNSQENDTSSG